MAGTHRHVAEIFENQRRLTSFNTWSARDLLPLDPAGWSDAGMKSRHVEIAMRLQ